MKKLLLVFASFILVSLNSHAGILIDPYFSYITSGSTSTNFTITGSDLGVRLGWTSLGLGLGIDSSLSGTHTYKDSTGSTDYTITNLGAFVSYTFPILVRGYATYFTNAKLASSTTTITGTATKIGVQYTGLPFIALGIEILNMSYKEAEINGIKGTSSASESQTRLALSVPFNL